jgi:hypothetical protein
MHSLVQLGESGASSSAAERDDVPNQLRGHVAAARAGAVACIELVRLDHAPQAPSEPARTVTNKACRKGRLIEPLRSVSTGRYPETTWERPARHMYSAAAPSTPELCRKDRREAARHCVTPWAPPQEGTSPVSPT